ncbi:GNAT family N-acetyltransferase [Palleronia caenipelagi]|uniref:GNAT family N-acetyltransferase n=1 Tax=Palleronia caenipelagi TaxID=2489174 RepID=A0A547PR50_9RHOB|nr:GNAT family N-acetyltransferase [Palleronia caenipelagi]TRD16615.1 GNAT family N-acetyltransferase [Palleronia caenipelagi]
MVATPFPRLGAPRPAPVLTTGRLRLRAMELGDWPTYRDALTSDHAHYIGGPFGLNAAWGMFCADMKGWEITGAGALSVETQDGTLVGQITLNDIPAFPELELGWLTYQGHEGKGYAAEAAATVLHWVRTEIAPASLVSYVSPDNPASSAIARKIGGTSDSDAPSPAGCDLVFRHIGGTN